MLKKLRQVIIIIIPLLLLIARRRYVYLIMITPHSTPASAQRH
jgi:hypothetical protein